MMGFLAGYRKKRQLTPEHKFEYINLRDFNDKSFVNVTAYIWIYLSILISLSCVAADTYTAITLLVFNRWSSQIQPVIPFETAKIIFAVCILISYVLILTDWFFALKVIKRGGVADAYMNVIALRWNCVWGGKGPDDSGWKRFLVFARLTKQRGKTDYVALVTYFSFKGWVRIVFAEGPRVVINAFTLASVISADLVPKDELETLSLISKFFENLGHLYAENKIQVLILGSMTFTTILWLFAILQLLLACILFISFLWHVMNGDSLRTYCKERIDKRMGEIVVDNHKKGLREDTNKMQKAGILRAPTIPVPAAVALETPSYEKTPYTMSVVQSPIGSPGFRPQQRQPTIPNLSEMERGRTPKPLARVSTSNTIDSSVRPSTGRSGKVLSSDSYDSSYTLVAGQAAMGYGGQGQARDSIDSLRRQQQWGPPPPVPYAQSSGGRSEGGKTPAPYAQSISSRSDSGRRPATREGQGYAVQDMQSPSAQSGRLPFTADRLAGQDEYGSMPSLREQFREQNQGQYGARPGPPSRSGSGRSAYGPRQGRFPIAVRTVEPQQERFPVAVRSRDPQKYYNGDSPQRTQPPAQYYTDSPQQMESPQDYYSQRRGQWDYHPPRQGTPQQQSSRQGTPQLPQQPQPATYEYLPPSQQNQNQSYQQEQPRPNLPRLQTQTPAPSGSGYKRPTYTPASATAPSPSRDFNDLPAGYFRIREDPVQMRSATTPPARPPARPQRAPLQQLGRSATAQVGRRGDPEPMRPPPRSATAGPERFAQGRTRV